MSTELVIAAVAPHVFNNNGDAENARVLARRLTWAGVPARLVAAIEPGEIDGECDAVVLGSCPESALPEAHAIVERWSGVLRAMAADERPILAVGTGLELLTEELETAAGERLRGHGLVPGSAPLLERRAVGEIVVEADGEMLTGFENHVRGVDAAGDGLGALRHGIGNGDGREGVRVGTLVGTHLHGPFLAKNPVVADELCRGLAARLGRRYEATSATTLAADDYARAARTALLERCGLEG